MPIKNLSEWIDGEDSLSKTEQTELKLINDEIAVLQTTTSRLKQRLKELTKCRDTLMNSSVKAENSLEIIFALADTLHKGQCTYNHIDQCSYEYSDWSTFDATSKQVSSRRKYYEKAKEMYETALEAGVTIEQLKKIWSIR